MELILTNYNHSSQKRKPGRSRSFPCLSEKAKLSGKSWAFILIMLICFFNGVMALADGVKPGSISGRVMIDEDLPMANGQIFIFDDSTGAPPSFYKYWRVPDEVVNIGADGTFRAVLADGKYYLGAIKRKSDEEMGPLQEGDLFLPFYANGAPIKYAITDGSSIDLGIISGAMPFRKSILKTGTGVTAIEGTVTNLRGKPLENALVFAFPTQAMVGKPLFISEKTGKDGKYLLRVYQGGNYYLKIRNSYGGGAMKAGEIMGSYGRDRPVAVGVKTGDTVKGIDITGTIFAGQGPKNNSKK